MTSIAKDNSSYGEADSNSTSPTTSGPSSITDMPTSSSSDGESFEGYGENECGGVNRRYSLTPSAKQMPTSTGRRHLASNAAGNQLFFTSLTFNSTGRDLNCDTSEGEMYREVSLDTLEDLSYKLEILQRQVADLTDTKHFAEVKNQRTKTEFAVLQARYHMLEDQNREAEVRAVERFAEEQKRHYALIARVEREAMLQNENSQIKIKSLEIETNVLHTEIQQLRVFNDKQASVLKRTEEQLQLAQEQISALQIDVDTAQRREREYDAENKATEDLMKELGRELEYVRAETEELPALLTSPPDGRLNQLQEELMALRERNSALEEENEELQATVFTFGFEEGRQPALNSTLNSLAQELEENSQAELQLALQAKKDENAQLKHYIDTVLFNIVENSPQLLELIAVERK